MPSSMCLAWFVADHFCADAIFAAANTSFISRRLNRPRWLTRGAEVVVDGDVGQVVTMRSAVATGAAEVEHDPAELTQVGIVRRLAVRGWRGMAMCEAAVALVALDAAAFE